MEQANAVWSGTHIGERQDEELNILLYQIDGFYVEVFYHRDYNVVRRFRSFSSTDQLTPYLEQLNFKGLL